MMEKPNLVVLDYSTDRTEVQRWKSRLEAWSDEQMLKEERVPWVRLEIRALPEKRFSLSFVPLDEDDWSIPDRKAVALLGRLDLIMKRKG